MFIKNKSSKIFLAISGFALLFSSQYSYSSPPSSTPEQLMPDKWIVDIAQESRKGLNKLCGKGEYFRKMSGSFCKDYSHGVIAMFVCGQNTADPAKAEEFIKSECADKIKLSPKTFDAAKAVLKDAVMKPVVITKTGEMYLKNAKWFVCLAFTPNIPNLDEFKKDPEIKARCGTLVREASNITVIKKTGVYAKDLQMALPKLISQSPSSGAVLLEIGGKSKETPKIVIKILEADIKNQQLRDSLLKAAQKLSEDLDNLIIGIDDGTMAVSADKDLQRTIKLEEGLKNAKSVAELTKVIENTNKEVTALK